VQVTFFQRKPRSDGNFSIEGVFESVRRELANKIDARVQIAPAYSNGLLRRILIALHAWWRQGEINHVTGDINFAALLLNGSRTILTNHDCGYILRTRGIRRWLLQRLWLELPVRRVAAVTTVSSQVKQEIVQYSRCPPEKIHVIPNAASPAFKPKLKPFHHPKPKILHVGTASNKNLPRLIAAVEGLNCTLVIVGEIDLEIAEQLHKTRVDFVNRANLPLLELVREYEDCDLVAFASLYEGFGVPILEAQAVGRPLLTSDRLPMSEVAGKGACLVDPTDPKAIRAGIDRIIGDSAYRDSLIEQGFENIQRFHPDRVAQQYFELYKATLSAAQ